MSDDFIELLGNATFTFVAAEQLPPEREDAIRKAVDKREGIQAENARAALAMIYHQRTQISAKDAEIQRLKRELAEAMRFGAPVDAKPLSYVKEPCKHHHAYWTTVSGSCMACRAVAADVLAEECKAWRGGFFYADGSSYHYPANELDRLEKARKQTNSNPVAAKAVEG